MISASLQFNLQQVVNYFSDAIRFVLCVETHCMFYKPAEEGWVVAVHEWMLEYTDGKQP